MRPAVPWEQNGCLPRHTPTSKLATTICQTEADACMPVPRPSPAVPPHAHCHCLRAPACPYPAPARQPYSLPLPSLQVS